MNYTQRKRYEATFVEPTPEPEEGFFGQLFLAGLYLFGLLLSLVLLALPFLAFAWLVSVLF